MESGTTPCESHVVRSCKRSFTSLVCVLLDHSAEELREIFGNPEPTSKMKSFVLIVWLASILAIVAANQPYEEVKPFTFQVADVPVVSSGYKETEYNLKPINKECYDGSEKDCSFFYKYLKVPQSYYLLCEFSQVLSANQGNGSRSKQISKFSADHVTESSQKANQEISDSALDQFPRVFLLSQKVFNLTSKITHGEQLSVDELSTIIDFNPLSNVTKFARFHKFKSCRFNETDSTIRVKLLEANVIETKKIIKSDTFRYLDSQECLVSYVGPELFVYDSLNHTYCPLKIPLYRLIDEKKPLNDECRTFSEPELLFLVDCKFNPNTPQFDQKKRNQVKRYGQSYYIYCYGQVKFNDDAPIKCPNSAFKVPVNTTVFIDGQKLSIETPLDSTIKLDDETNEKLMEVFQQIIFRI